MIASSSTSQNGGGEKRKKMNIQQNLVIFQKNRKIPFVLVGKCGNFWGFLFKKTGNLWQNINFSKYFSQNGKISPKKIITHMTCLFIIKGFLSTACPLRFSLVWVPHMSLSVSSPHKHHLAESHYCSGGCISLVASNLQCLSNSKFNVIQRPQGQLCQSLEDPISHELCNITTVVP